MNTSPEAALLEKLAEVVAQLGRPAIPIEVDLWDMASIAAYLKRDTQVVRERMACMPNFPKAIRLPTKQGRSQPLYRAKEIIEWAQSYQEKH